MFDYHIPKGDWRRNLNYWTGGAMSNREGQWGWCSGSESLNLSQNVIWGNNQPDNKTGNEGCIHMRFFPNATGVVLSDRNCKDKFVFACEVSQSLLNINNENYNNLFQLEQDYFSATNLLHQLPCKGKEIFKIKYFCSFK